MLHAEISPSLLRQDDREAVRRTLRLTSSATTSDVWTKVQILNLSETGLLIETTADLAVGEIFLVDLPEAGSTEARVAWRRDSSFGCQFLVPLPKAVLSSAQLRSQLSSENPDETPDFTELPVGIAPSLEELAQWKAEFERTKGATGHQLVGFRQTSSGMIIALVSRTN